MTVNRWELSPSQAASRLFVRQQQESMDAVRGHMMLPPLFTHTHTPTGREIDSKAARTRRQRGVNCPYREDVDAQREWRENRKELTSH